MPIAIKPNGKEIEVNDSSAKCLPDGWTLKGQTNSDNQLEAVRQKYEEVTGKKPHHKMGIEKMQQVIEGA